MGMAPPNNQMNLVKQVSVSDGKVCNSVLASLSFGAQVVCLRAKCISVLQFHFQIPLLEVPSLFRSS